MVSTQHDIAVAFARLTHKMGFKFLEFISNYPIKGTISRSRNIIFMHMLLGLGKCYGRFRGQLLEVLSI
jgi:hypothetical protein